MQHSACRLPGPNPLTHGDEMLRDVLRQASIHSGMEMRCCVSCSGMPVEPSPAAGTLGRRPSSSQSESSSAAAAPSMNRADVRHLHLSRRPNFNGYGASIIGLLHAVLALITPWAGRSSSFGVFASTNCLTALQ